MTTTRILAVTAGIGMTGFVAVLYANFGAFLPWRENAEAQQLIEITGVQAGWTVAEVGAGTGRFTLAMARAVGDAGKVYSSEISAANQQAIRARVGAAELRNVVLVDAGRLQTNLPDACCDLVFLRNVYHHITDPDAFADSLRAAVRPGGRVALIDFEPGALWFHSGRPAEASDRRPGHGVSRVAAVAELTKAGFLLEREVRDWSGSMWLVLLTR
jgi:SAM-dependent methyltransferase